MVKVEVIRGARAAWIAGLLGLSGCMPDGTILDPNDYRDGGAATSTAGTGGNLGTAGVAGSTGLGVTGSAAGNTAPRAGAGAAGSGGLGSGSAGAAGSAVSGGAAGSTGSAGRGSPTAAAGSTASDAGQGGRGGQGGRAGGDAEAGAGGEGGEAGEGGTGGEPPAPTWTEIYDDLFAVSCNGCHGPGEGGLNTGNKMSAHMNLVGVDSRSCEGRKRVEPGDPEASVLFLAVDQSSSGDCDPPDMPRGAPKWDQADIDKLRAWIEAGAPND